MFQGQLLDKESKQFEIIDGQDLGINEQLDGRRPGEAKHDQGKFITNDETTNTRGSGGINHGIGDGFTEDQFQNMGRMSQQGLKEMEEIQQCFMKEWGDGDFCRIRNMVHGLEKGGEQGFCGWCNASGINEFAP